MAHVEALCKQIEERRQQYFRREIDKRPNTAKNNPTASDVGECAREIALQMFHPKPDIDAWLKARFERGNLIEDFIMRDLIALGYRPRVERQPFELKDSKGRLICRGKVDGFLDYDVPGEAKPRTFPFECKSLDPNVFRRINTVEDFNRFTFAAKYPRQLQLYMYGYNYEEGFFILDDCLGHWKMIPNPLDYLALDAVIKRLEKAVEARAAVQAGADPEVALPAFHEDPAVCRKCWAFGRHCNPPLEYHGLSALTDPELEAKLDRRGEVERFADEYEVLDKEIKERVKGQSGLVIGNWLVNGKEVAQNFKEQPAKPAFVRKFWRTDITKIEQEPEAGE